MATGDLVTEGQLDALVTEVAADVAARIVGVGAVTAIHELAPAPPVTPEAGHLYLVPGSAGGGGVEDAPVDGSRYVRQDGAWVPTVSDGLTRADILLSPTVVVKPAVGEYVGNLLTGTLTTQVHVANAERATLFSTMFDLTVDEVRVSVSTGVAGTARVFVYETDPATGLPSGDPLAVSADLTVTTTAGTYALALSFTFLAGKTYWLTLWCSSAATFRAGQTYSNYVITWTTAATPAAEQVLQRTNAGGATTAWTYAAAQHTNARAPLILLRVAT